MRVHSHVVSVETEVPPGAYATTRVDTAGKNILTIEAKSNESVEDAEAQIVVTVGRIIAAVKA